VENNQAVVEIAIEEGNRLLIQKISFEGNRAFSESELAGLMATKEKWIFSFLNDRGVLDRDILTNDLAILSAYYYDHGYISHKIDEPVILKERSGIEVVIRVVEGEQFRVGKVEIGGELVEEPEMLLSEIQLTTGQIFRGSRLRGDIDSLTQKYAERGFAFADVRPITKVHPEEKKVDIALVVTRGPPVHFNRIMVAGNTKTRDKVIRRELEVQEQKLYSGKRIKQSQDALQRTGYFEDVQVTTKKTDQPDAVDLLVEVKEGPTGSLGLGAGYSGGDNVFLTASVSEQNLFGRGQKLNASFDLGTQRQDFNVSFTEPYLYDTPLTLGVNAFNTRRESSTFTERKTGFRTQTSYPLRRLNLPFFKPTISRSLYGDDEVIHHPLVKYTRAGIAYEFRRDKIGSLEDDAPVAVRDEEGISFTSSVTPNLSYDSRDHFFTPTKGTRSDMSLKFAGLGGDNRFLKSDVSGRWYYSFLKDPNWGGTYTLALGGTAGYGAAFQERSNGRKNLPLSERYFPGGMGSVRGFEDRSLGPQEEGEAVGGDMQTVLNAEVFFPIIEDYGLRGVAFFDMGQAFAESEGFDFGDLRRSVGAGVRWLSPFGPVRVDLGFPLNKQPGDETSVLGFSLGG
jgi:outer membrane protein insertion porin family